ncbi:MAG: ATP-dependent RecD-like DNA helicase [Anaerovoracaceae bacterium]|jgi:exodeoxyribonuclease V alpha subunit
MKQLEVTIENIVFHNKDNGYTIAVVNTEEEQFTAVGVLPSCHPGRTYVLRGEFTVHPNYGEQFAFKESEEVMPSTEAGIADFLSSGFLKGVGPKAAAAIVKKFGKDTFDVIETTPERLTQVSGIGEKRAAAIAEAFRLHKEFAEITIYLGQFDISGTYAMKLYKVYGSDTIAAVEENPYRLATEVFGIGFIQADRIAAKMGIEKENEDRIRSGITYTLLYYSGEGNTFLPRSLLKEKAAEMLEISTELVDDALVGLAFEGEVRIENLEGREVVYLMAYFVAEQNVTKCLTALDRAPLKPVNGEQESLIAMAEKEAGIKYSREQKHAVGTCLKNGVSVITGGPGTGKTTIINGILKILEHNGFKIAIAAPTGRAAKRITETTGHAASTIHRLLEYSYFEGADEMRFGRNEENPLDMDVVIIDEASMVDLMLMNGLAKALKPGTRLVLVGDADQLPSVGAGNVLSDILDSEYIYSVRLREIFRQAKESLIVVNAHRINQGEYPDFNEREKDFFLMTRKTEADMLATILELCEKRLPNHYTHIDPMQDIQVLTPVRRGTLGTINLNKEMREKLNPPSSHKNERSYGDKLFREGDKVMQIKNNYDLAWKRIGDFTQGEGIFNGDLGYIEKIDPDHQELVAVFDEDKYVTYGFSDLDQLEPAYAVTVHKSQGSEFPIVVMPMSWFPPMLATRNLLYTAVTRGKEAVVLVGSEGKMKAMVDNNRIVDRYSGLKARLASMINGDEEIS